MKRMYAAVLRLYPVEFQQMFAVEMLRTFEQAGAAKGGFWFAAKEFAGLLRGAATEHFARLVGSRRYLHRDFESALNASASECEIARLIQSVIGEMQCAIAHHDFPRARSCSEQEKRARRRLNELSGAER